MSNLHKFQQLQMIREIIEKGGTAFVCDAFEHIKQFIKISEDEGITYQKMGWKESEEKYV
jgi:hypothetical protein